MNFTQGNTGRTAGAIKPHPSSVLWLLCAIGVGSSGCAQTTRLQPAEYFPLHRAAEIVNQNNAPFTQRPRRLYIEGRWSGYFTDSQDQKRRGDGGFKIHMVSPHNLSFKTDMGLLTNQLFEAGSNNTFFWFWAQEQGDTLYFDTWTGETALQVNGVPIDPTSFMSALGVDRLDDTSIGHEGVRYRVTDEAHQLLYERATSDAQWFIYREYWLNRRPPFLMDRVIQRQPDGQMSMDARLSDYADIPDSTMRVARRIVITWPLTDAKLDLKLSKIKFYDDIDHIAFVIPHERAKLNPYHVPPKHIERLETRSFHSP